MPEPRPRVKICGLTRRLDAEAAARLGASYLGTVLVPGSPRHVTPEEARRVTEGLEAVPVAVVADLGVAGTVEAAGAAGAEVVQLHGSETVREVTEVADAGPWKVWKVLRLGAGALDRDAALEFSDVADGLLLDAWHPRRLGGTGRPFPWDEAAPLLAELRGRVLRIAAGGLDPSNVGRAVEVLDPDVVDVSSGVESEPGVKDQARIRRFLRRARSAGAPLSP